MGAECPDYSIATPGRPDSLAGIHVPYHNKVIMHYSHAVWEKLGPAQDAVG